MFLASVGNTGDTHEVDVTMNVVGVSRARDENQPFSGKARRWDELECAGNTYREHLASLPIPNHQLLIHARIGQTGNAHGHAGEKPVGHVTRDEHDEDVVHDLQQLSCLRGVLIEWRKVECGKSGQGVGLERRHA